MPRFKRKRSRRRTGSRKGVKRVKRNAKTGRGIDKAQSKAIVKIMRKMKADRPELKIFEETGYTDGTLLYLPPYASGGAAATYVLLGPAELLAGAAFAQGVGDGQAIGLEIQPKMANVTFSLKNHSSATQSYTIYNYWINTAMIDNVDMNSLVKLDLALGPNRAVNNWATTIGSHDVLNFLNVLPWNDKSRYQGEGVNAAYGDLAKGMRGVSKKRYELRGTTASTNTYTTMPVVRKHSISWRWPPGARWRMPTNFDSDGDIFALNSGWIPVVALTCSSATSISICDKMMMSYTDS